MRAWEFIFESAEHEASAIVVNGWITRLRKAIDNFEYNAYAIGTTAAKEDLIDVSIPPDILVEFLADGDYQLADALSEYKKLCEEAKNISNSVLENKNASRRK